MSRAIGNWQLAIGKNKRLGHCLLPISSHATAVSFTVTRRGTSVTTLQLAESDLIIVGKLASRRLPEKRLLAANSGCNRVLRCSFQWGMRIQ